MNNSNLLRILYHNLNTCRLVTMFICMMLMLVLYQPLLAQQEHMHDNHQAPDGSSIGAVEFNANCSEAVATDVDYAIGMLHHMMYENSREIFEEITRNDTGCAIAHWGIATTLFQPIWGTRPGAEDLQYGWEQINTAMELAETERESSLIKSTYEFFRDPESADFRTRIDRWASSMEDVYQKYPDDPDIAALYGLSRLTIAQFAADRGPLYDETERILREVYEQIPTHPGAVHYSIHATDVDGRAGNALDIVEVYSDIAPEVPHALHMPSHIYVRLGDWPQVINWNQKSAEAALNYPLNGAESHHYIHAIDYLVYAYLQRGEDEKAEATFEKALTKDRHQQSFPAAFHFAAIPARLAVEQHDWERAANLTPRTPDYLPWDQSPWAEALTWYARGLGAVHTGNMEAASEAEKRMHELSDIAEERGDNNMVVYIEADRHVLAGRIALQEGNEEKALELIRKATELEESVEKHPVTPGALQPTYEALGDVYMNLNRPLDALTAYERADQLWPGRFNTLMGAALAAKMTGETKLARAHFERLIRSAGGLEVKAIGEAMEH